MKKLLFAVCAFTIVLSACDKNEKIGKRFEILRDHQWRLVSQNINGADQPLDECETGNYWVFKADEYGYEANVTCGDTQVVVIDTTGNGTDTTIVTKPQNKSTVTTATPTQIDFTWSVTGDQRYIYIKNFGTPGHDIDWEIVSMDNSKFHVKGNYIVNDVNYVFEKYFEAK